MIYPFDKPKKTILIYIYICRHCHITIMSMAQVRVKTTRKIDRPGSFRPYDLAHVYAILHRRIISSLWFLRLLCKLLPSGIFCYSHFARYAKLIQIRPIEQRPVLLAHTLCSILQSIAKNNRKERATEQINKGKYNLSKLDSLYHKCARCFFINFTDLFWCLFFLFLVFFQQIRVIATSSNFRRFR